MSINSLGHFSKLQEQDQANNCGVILFGDDIPSGHTVIGHDMLSHAEYQTHSEALKTARSNLLFWEIVTQNDAFNLLQHQTGVWAKMQIQQKNASLNHLDDIEKEKQLSSFILELIKKYPVIIDHFISLNHLPGSRDQESAKLTEIPDYIGEFRNLRHIDLSGHNIEKVSPSIAKLDKLATLALRDNSLACIPKDLGSLSELELLSLRGNAISQISSDEVSALSGIRCLRTLNLSRNGLKNDSSAVEELKRVDLPILKI